MGNPVTVAKRFYKDLGFEAPSMKNSNIPPSVIKLSTLPPVYSSKIST